VRHRADGALPPGPPLLAPIQTLLVSRWPFVFLKQCRERYGARFTVNITSHPPLVFLADPADVSDVLAGPHDVLHPGEGAGTIEPLVGERSFMLMDGDEHLYGRRAVLPAFRASAVREDVQLIQELAAREVAKWPLDAPVSLHGSLRALTLQTLLSTSFSPRSGPERQMLCLLHQRLLEMLTITASAALPEPLLRRGPARRIWRRFLCQRASVDELIYTIIEHRARSADHAGDLLDRLLGARNPDGSARSFVQIRDDLMSVILAGHETTASQLAWALQLLAHNPAVQDRLAEQLDAGEGGGYLTATVKEVLRCRPVFLFAIPRSVKQPIDIGPFTYNPPAQLLACIYLLHHDPVLHPEPDKFRPERFMEKSPPAWLPWGGGRKRCPGLHLATLEIETVLRTVLATMTVRPAAPTIERPRWRSVIVTPHRGCRVVVHPRRSAHKTPATPH
jgi:cytochrome P450